MTPETQKKMSGELQADLQALLDDALKECQKLRAELDGCRNSSAHFQADYDAVAEAAQFVEKDTSLSQWVLNIRLKRDTAVEMATMLAEKMEIVAKERDDLKGWKESQLQVDSGWNPQEIGRVLNLPIGANIRASLMPEIQKLIRERGEAQAKCAEMQAMLKQEFINHRNAQVRCAAVLDAFEALHDFINGKRKDPESLAEIFNSVTTIDCVNGWMSPEQFKEALSPAFEWFKKFTKNLTASQKESIGRLDPDRVYSEVSAGMVSSALRILEKLEPLFEDDIHESNNSI